MLYFYVQWQIKVPLLILGIDMFLAHTLPPRVYVDMDHLWADYWAEFDYCADDRSFSKQILDSPPLLWELPEVLQDPAVSQNKF